MHWWKQLSAARRYEIEMRVLRAAVWIFVLSICVMALLKGKLGTTAERFDTATEEQR